MPGELTGQITAFFLHDVAESMDLAAARTLLGGAGQSARLPVRQPIPAYVRYTDPPVQVDGEAVGLGPVDGFQVRVTIYDYGVVSLSLSRPFHGPWAELVRLAQWTAAAGLDVRAEEYCRQAAQRLAPAMTHPRAAFLAEDYFVYAVTGLESPATADALVAAHGDDIAQVLRGEGERLSPQERDEVLRHRLSYFASDLVIPSWNAAFVYDTEAGLTGALEILEFANSQLLEFRHYDQRLDEDLTRIYARLQATRWYSPGSAGATRQPPASSTAC
ncbi:MAG: hypothetical protein R2712_09445 [Vicinamibacterales bacterium]